jgi:glutamate-5-semialdehyde dehydrogenase
MSNEDKKSTVRRVHSSALASATAEPSVEKAMHKLAEEARAAARKMAVATREQKDKALRFAAEELTRQRDALLKANAEDLERGRKAGLAEPLLDRLRLDAKTLARLEQGLMQVSALPDPVGETIGESVRPSGLKLRRVRVPIGTIFIIFESRPNVTMEAGSLCLKSGNACILRGGSEAFSSNQALVAILRKGLERAGLPAGAVCTPPTAERTAVTALLKLDSLIDLVIPRGGESLIRTVVQESRIPTIKHYKGVCHVYVDRAADADLAEKIVVNSKLQRVAVCNAAETLLVHKEIAPSFLPCVAEALLAQRCELRVEPLAKAILAGAGIVKVTDADPAAFYNEYLDRIMNVRVVDSLEEATDHIERFGSRHTETIVTRDAEAGRRFQQLVDSSSVFVNCSTRMSDGFEFGLGAEIGISTDKLHARGPMGLESLTTYKWLGDGDGVLRT